MLVGSGGRRAVILARDRGDGGGASGGGSGDGNKEGSEREGEEKPSSEQARKKIGVQRSFHVA